VGISESCFIFDFGGRSAHLATKVARKHQSSSSSSYIFHRGDHDLDNHNYIFISYLPLSDGKTSATESHLLAQEAWLLRTAAIELRLTSASRQRSHTQRLLNLLMDDTPLLQQKGLFKKVCLLLIRHVVLDVVCS